jgi:hypothetical protein
MASSPYPFGFEADPPAPQSRLTVLFRLILALPHLIIVSILGYAIAVVTLIAWVAILITGKYPQGLLSFAVNVQHWGSRSNGYMYLLTGAYPPFALGPDTSYPVRMTGEGVVEGRNRLTVFFRIFMIIPHLIVLAILGVVAAVVWVIAWIAALITGSVPAGMHNFMEGVLRWTTRVTNYAYLFNDEYPPFSLQ